MDIATNGERQRISAFFQDDQFRQIIKLTDGRLIANLNDQTLIDVQAKTVFDEETNELIHFNWYVCIQVFPVFEKSELPNPQQPQCTCPSIAQTHDKDCTFYAPSPQEIYKQNIMDRQWRTPIEPIEQTIRTTTPLTTTQPTYNSTLPSVAFNGAFDTELHSD